MCCVCHRPIRYSQAIFYPTAYPARLHGIHWRPTSGARGADKLSNITEISLLQRYSFICVVCVRSVAASTQRSLSASYLHLPLITSRLNYCNSLLAGARQSTLGVLQRVQNAAARLIFELGPRDHLTDSLIQLHWLPIRWRVQYKLVMLMYGIVVGTCPEYLRTIVKQATPSHPGLRSAACSAPKFVVPRLLTKFSERAFSFSGPVAWNSLPADIRCTTNRQTFKTLLKSHFFRQAFDIS